MNARAVLGMSIHASFDHLSLDEQKDVVTKYVQSEDFVVHLPYRPAQSEVDVAQFEKRVRNYSPTTQ